MSEAANLLRGEIEQYARALGVDTAWSYFDLESGEATCGRGAEPVPVGDQDALIQYLAFISASTAGDIDLSAKYELRDEHRDDAHNGVIGCMSNGLVLSLGDYLAQTVITGDAAAFAVVREAIAAQGVSARDLVDRYLSVHGAGPLDGRPVLAGAGRSGIEIGSTTTNEQIRLLFGLVDDAHSSDATEAVREAAMQSLTVLSSVLKGGGLVRGLPGYGPFKTKVAHSARVGNGNSGSVRSDCAIYFHKGVPRFLVSVCVSGIEEWSGALPGMAIAEELFRDVSRACWAATVDEF